MSQARRGGLPLLEPEQIAEAVLVAARSEQTGQAWVCQPGREPTLFRFPGVPAHVSRAPKGMCRSSDAGYVRTTKLPATLSWSAWVLDPSGQR